MISFESLRAKQWDSTVIPLFRVDNKASNNLDLDFFSLISVCMRGAGRLLQNIDSRREKHSMYRGKWGGCHGNRV